MLTRATNGRQDSSLQRPISHRHHAVLWSHHLDADPDFYLMRMRIQMQVTKMMRIRVHNTGIKDLSGTQKFNQHLN
jgi:hypothetical protein